MYELKKSAEIYSKYVDYNYTFILDCGISINAMFKADNFYHLTGLHYLTDIVQLDKRLNNNSAKTKSSFSKDSSHNTPQYVVLRLLLYFA